MVWKIEQWLSEVFPGEKEIYGEYRSLPARELVIVSAAVLDVALAQLLSLRLGDIGKESSAFLGLNGDGRAPVGPFGARIQLALLIGLLTLEDATILRSIKELRNIFAHRVNVNFLTPSVVKITIKLHDLWLKRATNLIESRSGAPEHLSEIAKLLPTIPEAGEGLLLAVFTTYQAYFNRMHCRVMRLGDALSKQGEGKTN